MAVSGMGALAGWFDYTGTVDMNEWQAREHILERVVHPGFIRGRRYEAPDAHPEYFMFYETTDVNVLSSAGYLERLNKPTDWSRRSSAGLYNMKRSACRVTATFGSVDGGSVATCELLPAEGHAESLKSRIANETLPELIRQPGTYAAHLLETDQAITRIQTVEKRLRGGADDSADWVIVVEGRDPGALRAAVARLPERLGTLGAERVSTPQLYRLSFAATP